MVRYFRNSDFKKDKYFTSFFENLEFARKTNNKELEINIIRQYNNCSRARKLKGDIKIQDIFNDNRDAYLAANGQRDIRETVLKNVSLMRQCKSLELGMNWFECPNCGKFYVCMHTCKSMFCPTCGAKRRDKISANVAKKVLDIPHRQLVFTVPCELRSFFRKYREQISLIFSAVNETLTSVVKDKAPRAYKKEQRRLGCIAFLHTFGRDLKRHPHIHVLFAEKTIDKNGEMKDIYFLKYDYIRKYFLYSLIKKIRNFLSTSKKVDNEMRTFFRNKINDVQIKLKNGAYFYGKKSHIATSINSVKKMSKYISRYASHPAISERRILKYDPKTKMVTWYYDPHQDDNKDEGDETRMGRQIVTEHAFDFISRLIVHINDKHFAIVRYYGFYSNNSLLKKVHCKKLFSPKEIDEIVLRLKWKFGILYAFGYNPLLCECGTEMIYNEKNLILRGGAWP